MPAPSIWGGTNELGLAAGASTTRTIYVDLPDWAKNGAYFIVVANSKDTLFEPVKINNTRAFPFKNTNNPPVIRDYSMTARTKMPSKVFVDSLVAQAHDPDGDPLEFIWSDFPKTSANGVRIEAVKGSKRLGVVAYNVDNMQMDTKTVDTFSFGVQDGFGGTNRATMFVKFADPVSSRSNFVFLKHNPDATISITFLGISGRSYRVQGTSDLNSPWKDLSLFDNNASLVFTNVFSCVNSTIMVTDPAPLIGPQWYYRSTILP